MKVQLLIGVAATMVLTACNSGTSDQQPSEVATTDVAPPTAEAALPAVPAPQTFVDAAASSDMYEVEAAKLAQKSSKSEKVKSFAEMMITDHTASTEKLKAAVATAGNLTVPTSMQPRHQANLDTLKAAGDNFDAVYARQQVAAHEEALALLKGEAASGTIEPLKAFAAEIAPIVETHLGHARDLP